MEKRILRIRRYLLAAWLTLAGLISLLSVWAHMLIGLNSDHLANLEGARKLLAGAVPYVDFVEPNPPLIFILYSIPVAIASVTGIPMYIVLYLLTYALLFGALWIVFVILKRSGATLSVNLVTVSAAALALLTASFIHQPFADREHWMLVLITPWLALYSPLVQREAISPRLRMLIAVMAGISFAIKPYFYVFYLATVLFSLATGTRLRDMLRQREHHIVCAIAATYVIIVLLFFRHYLTVVLPIGLKTYPAISWDINSKLSIITHDFVGYAIPGLAALALLWWGDPRRLDRSVAYLGVLVLAGVGSYLLNAGWYYTQYPFIAISLVATIAIGARLLSTCWQFPTPFQQSVRVFLSGILLAAGLGYAYGKPALLRAQWDIGTQQSRGHPAGSMEMHPPAMKTVGAYLEKYPRFMLLSTSLWQVNLMKEEEPQEGVGRFDLLWTLPGTLQIAADPERREESDMLVRYLQESLAEDLERHRPELVINDVSPIQRGLPLSYNVLELLTRSDRFATAWTRYGQAEKIDSCNDWVRQHCAYEIYIINK